MSDALVLGLALIGALTGLGALYLILQYRFDMRESEREDQDNGASSH